MILEPHCLRMFEPCLNDKMLKGSFKFSFLKKWIHIDAEYMRQAAPMLPQSSPTHLNSKMWKAM